ncbi:MAG: hypothetical protein HDT15_06240 [Oscillibacter sp.]|nr:hypothetical protein [Oscillibacter sp.]
MKVSSTYDFAQPHRVAVQNLIVHNRSMRLRTIAKGGRVQALGGQWPPQLSGRLRRPTRTASLVAPRKARNPQAAPQKILRQYPEAARPKRICRKSGKQRREFPSALNPHLYPFLNDLSLFSSAKLLAISSKKDYNAGKCFLCRRTPF